MTILKLYSLTHTFHTYLSQRFTIEVDGQETIIWVILEHFDKLNKENAGNKQEKPNTESVNSPC